MIAGKQYEGPKADVWSMGVILFALVCGYLPFEDASTHVLYQKILSGDYKIPSLVSPSTWMWSCVACLAQGSSITHIPHVLPEQADEI
jgi:serine/threonine protein kinase